MKKFGNVLWGLLFIVVGGIWALNSLGITNINIFFDGWWTLFIIVPCFIGIFTDSDKTGSAIGMLVGIVLLLACRGIFDFDMVWKLAIPAILIAIGLSFIFKNSINNVFNKEIKKINENQKVSGEYSATFSSQDLKFDNEKFEGANLNAVFGGVKCDLRKAIITKDTVINVTSVFGGVEIYVPNDVKIKIKSTPIFGGVSDKTNQTLKDDSKTIYINATAIFGGAEIK